MSWVSLASVGGSVLRLYGAPPALAEKTKHELESCKNEKKEKCWDLQTNADGDSEADGQEAKLEDKIRDDAGRVETSGPVGNNGSD